MASSSRVPSRMAWTAGVVMFCFALAPTTAALLDTREAADDRIVSLPGWGPVETGMYGGYITVDAAAGRALYYILAESSDPDAPLLLWLNGGPGCSSIGGGFMTELGPFFPTSDGRLEQNRFSWVGGAGHVLFLESPAFVGFSYSNTTSDRVVGDARTTQDSLAFLQGFFQRFPRLADSAFWITGESYAGHYIPALAQAVLLHNQRVAAQPQDGNQPVINLKGLLAGNPWTDAASDNIGQIDFLTDHFVLSPETAARIRRDCDIQTVWPLKPRLFLSSLPPRRSDGRSEAHHMSRKCQERFAEAYQEMGGTSVYDVYEDVCLENVAASSMEALLSTFLEQQAPPSAGAGAVPRTDAQRRTGGAAAASRRLLRQRQPWEVGNAVVLDPCVESEAENYLNRPDVQAAIHANVSGHLPWRWTDCSSLVQYNQADAVASMLPVYRFLMQHHSLTLLVYSGDVDASVPATGTKLWLDKLNLTVAEPWRPWKAGFRYGGLQTAGHVVKYQEGISFVTVRGAGHMVPYTQPARALSLVSRVVNGQPL